MGKLVVIVGGQFGSEGKGAIAGYLARTEQASTLLAVRVAGPNAGHTVYDDEGKKFAMRQLPVASIVRPEARLAIAAGAEIDPAVLKDEIAMYKGAYPIVVDEQATWIENRHKEQETGMSARIGSTEKGIGGARADRIMRRARIVKEPWARIPRTVPGDVATLSRNMLASDAAVHVEGAQGFGLGLHAGFYPQCTSSDCRAIDFLSMAGISPWAPEIGVGQFHVWIVYRARPIRVAGNSGPLFGETTWDRLRQETEYTTVTSKVRRVGAWDPALAWRALVENGGPNPSTVFVALTMLDKEFPQIAGVESNEELEERQGHRAALQFLQSIEGDLGVPISLVGTGPHTIWDRRSL